MENKRKLDNVSWDELIKMSVREVYLLIDDYDCSMPTTVDFENNELDEDVIYYEFNALPNFKVKGHHVKPFYQRGRW